MGSILRYMGRRTRSVLMVAAILPALSIAAWSDASPATAPNSEGNAAESPAATVCDGVFSADQALRGQEIFATECAQCHGANFRGGFGVASLTGPAFTSLWGDKSLWALFDRMKSTMPLDSAGALSDQDYLDVLARILEVNEFPASGDSELPLLQDELEQLTVPKNCPEKESS